MEKGKPFLTPFKLFLLVITAVAFACLVGCMEDKAANVSNVASAYSSTSKIVDYGNGVFYFPYTEAEFGNALSAFLKEHPEWELVTFDGNPDKNKKAGWLFGYFVGFRKKQLPAESVK
ncbi:MAG: hypothetical protein AAB345_01555 [Patescibacteria group bacterium]